MFGFGKESRLRDETGAGLTEVMMAIVILTVASLSLAGTSVRVGTTMSAVQGRISAMEVAERQLEQLHSTDYAAIANGSKVEDGVQLTWTVTEGDVSKQILMVYRYDLPRSTRQDTLIAAVRAR